MSTKPIVIGPDAGLADAARRMAHHGVKRLLVVDDRGRLVGVVSRADLVKVFLRSDDDIREEILDEVLVHLLWVDPTEVGVDVTDGVVTLTGTVDGAGIAENAERLARRVDGVVDVRSLLTHRLAGARHGRTVRRGRGRLSAADEPDR